MAGVDTMAESVGRLMGMGASLVELLFWSFIIVLMVGLGWFIWWMLSFNITVLVKEKVSRAFMYQLGAKYGELAEEEETNQTTEGKEEKKEKFEIIPTVVRIFKGKILKKRGTRTIQLQFGGKIKLPDQIYHTITNRGKKFIELLKISKFTYLPVVLKSDEGIEKYVDDDSYIEWVANDMESDNKKFQELGFWDRYGSWVLGAGFLILMLLIIVVTFKYSQTHVDSSKEVANAFVSAAEIMSKQPVCPG